MLEVGAPEIASMLGVSAPDRAREISSMLEAGAPLSSMLPIGGPNTCIEHPRIKLLSGGTSAEWFDFCSSRADKSLVARPHLPNERPNGRVRRDLDFFDIVSSMRVCLKNYPKYTKPRETANVILMSLHR